jgi:hypothetical protein
MAGKTRSLQQSESCQKGSLEYGNDRARGLLEADVLILVRKRRGATHV